MSECCRNSKNFMPNALSIDVEDYWKIFSHDWLGKDMTPTDAVVRNTHELLEIFESHNTKATFFVLGEVAKKFPDLTREIHSLGHEVAIHGYNHFVIYTINKEKFYQEVSDAKKLIEDILGQAVNGHRAPSFSIGPTTKWALEVLAELGYKYDSSVFPFSGKRYGWDGFKEDICNVKLENGDTIIEVPMSTVKICGRNFPACGGGYLRHFPYIYTKWAMSQIQKKRPSIVYMHPYDFDTKPGPEDIESSIRTDAPLKSKIRHALQLRNRKTMRSKLLRLLNTYKFAPIRDIIAAKSDIETYDVVEALRT